MTVLKNKKKRKANDTKINVEKTREIIKGNEEKREEKQINIGLAHNLNFMNVR